MKQSSNSLFVRSCLQPPFPLRNAHELMNISSNIERRRNMVEGGFAVIAKTNNSESVVLYTVSMSIDLTDEVLNMVLYKEEAEILCMYR